MKYDKNISWHLAIDVEKNINFDTFVNPTTSRNIHQASICMEGDKSRKEILYGDDIGTKRAMYHREFICWLIALH